MNERPVQPTDDTRRLQREAGNPQSSVWVSANAGSGKTYILTERVLRLLLSGVRPENILCLTYTKAAAAEMKSRVSARLAKWATCSETDLREELAAVTGQQAETRTITLARALFAHALETPGGLKINTIHAFCEAVLQRFAFEAGVPVGFAVVEEIERADMVRHAVDTVLAEGLAGHPEVAEAVGTLFAVLSDFQIDTAVNAALAQSRALRDVLAHPDAARKNLADLLGVPQNLTRGSVEAEAISGGAFGRAAAESVMAITPPDADKNRFEDKLARIDWQQLHADDLFAAFLTQAGQIPKRGLPKAEIIKTDPLLAEAIGKEAERLAALFSQQKAADILSTSGALLDVMQAVDARYQRAKALANRLDFDDLIARLVALLDVKAARDWVRYKLDSAITHILVDESQDTNPDQWRVVTQLTEEFFAGRGAVEAVRTIFAVGDEKQSIYSFQGADPTLFGETGDAIRLRASQSDAAFVRRTFRASFRTQENILNAVDEVARDPEVATGLLLDENYPGHESAREHQGGIVTLWPPILPEDDEPGAHDWPETPRVALKTPPHRLAVRIVSQIADWIDSCRPLGQRQRAVTADDVLILVQTRGPLFGAIIAELKRRNIPTPGADRVSVTGHIVTADLLALADVLFNPDDDLTLAAVLRSPLFNVNEDQLFELAHGRHRKPLWHQLREAAGQHPWAATAFERLSGWRARLDFERPYEFFARVLYAEGGLKLFRNRLGGEIDDVIAEFLDLALAHEQSAQPGLLGFIVEMRARDVAIKRELAETGNGVRVMTVHGAKGLEAPIVILADAASSQTRTGPVYVQGAPRPILAHVANKQAHVDQTLEALRQPDENRQRAEMWRMLYVGMTRAEDELYVTGFLNKNARLDGTWYDRIETALKPLAKEIELKGEEEVTAWRYPVVVPEPARIKSKSGLASPEVSLPDMAPLPRPSVIETISPSRAADHSVELAEALQTATVETLEQAPASTSADLARRQGTALHALLQHLEKVPDALRTKVAFDALAVLLPDHRERHQALVSKAASIMSGPHASLLFGQNSRAEIPFLLQVCRNSQRVRLAGRIDRTIVTENEVTFVDFKSDAQPARQLADVPPAYLTQLGLYRLAGKKLFAGRRIRAALFWTAGESLMELPSSALDAAIAGYTLE